MKQNKNLLLIKLGITAILFSACNSPNINYDHDISLFSENASSNQLSSNFNSILEKIKKVNSISTLLNNHKNLFVACSYLNTIKEGNFEYSYFLGTDKNGYVYCASQSNNYIKILKNGTFYIKDETDNYGVGEFVKDSYETTFLPRIEHLFFSYDESEQIIAHTLEKDNCQITTKTDITEKLDLFNPYWDIADPVIYKDYQINPNTFLIQGTKIYLKNSDGTHLNLIVTENKTDINYKLPDYIKELENSSETKIIHLILNPKTPFEEIFEYTIPKNAFFYPYLSDEYKLYTDKECTIPYEFKEELELFQNFYYGIKK